ncbi:hypothetical protein [Roseibium sp. M-1]
MRQQHTFGRRGQAVDRQQMSPVRRSPADPVSQPKSFHQELDDYEDAVLTRFVATRPWPACAAVAIVLLSFGSSLILFADRGLPPFGLFPVMLIVGYVMYLQFKGMQANLNNKEERDKRAVSAKYPLVPIFSMIAGLVYFMVTKEQSLSDIAAYDWESAFTGPVDIEAPPALPVELVEKIGSFGGAGLFLAYLLYRARKHFSGEV